MEGGMEFYRKGEWDQLQGFVAFWDCFTVKTYPLYLEKSRLLWVGVIHGQSGHEIVSVRFCVL